MLRYQSRALMRHQLMLYVALSKQSFDAPSVYFAYKLDKEYSRDVIDLARVKKPLIPPGLRGPFFTLGES
jgi:hypothetical protein